MPTQQIDLLSEQVGAQQQQIQHLTSRNAQLSVDHQLMLQEMLRVQKTVLNHENVIHQVMSYLLSLDARQQRGSKASVSFQTPGQGSSAVSPSVTNDDAPPPPTPLQNATKLLSDMNADLQVNADSMEALGDPQKAAAAAANAAAVNMVPAIPMENGARNPAVQPAPASMASTSTASNSGFVYPKMNGELGEIVYPVGGIDPTAYNGNIGNVPYPMPPKEMDSSDAIRRQFPENRKKSANIDPGWIRNPQILLVEDDGTCRQIGGKFLISFSCVIDSAVSIYEHYLLAILMAMLLTTYLSSSMDSKQ